MKIFDIFAWSEAPIGVAVAGVGPLSLRLSAPAAVYVSQEGYEVLLGYGDRFDYEFGGAYAFRVEGKGVRAFHKSAGSAAMESTGEVFTNARRPETSGSYYEVRRALREQQLQQRSFLKEMRQATAALRAARAPAPAPVAPPAAAPAAAPAAPPVAGPAE